MQLPQILQKESVTLLRGAFVGFAATAIIGFTWGGWTLEKTAKEMADKSATTAVVTALAPIWAGLEASTERPCERVDASCGPHRYGRNLFWYTVLKS